MRWGVYWEHSAVLQILELAGADPRLGRRIVDVVTAFSRGERVDRKKLRERPDMWRLRHGDWRIILTVDGADAYIESIDNRRDAY
jgi:mRNA-degrading endonuclease RelE of RelBE toxin-antitoxin system